MNKKIIIVIGIGAAVFFLMQRRAMAAQQYFPGYVVPPVHVPINEAGASDLIEDNITYEMRQGTGEFFPVVPASPIYVDSGPDNWDLQGDTSSSNSWGFVNDILSTFTEGGSVIPASMNANNAQQQQNLAAFLAVIREGEGTADPDGYRRLFGGQLIDNLSDHPRTVVTATLGGKPIKSSAAGAYQALSRTWDDFIRAVGPRDFSPASQDEFAIWAIKRRGALNDVLNGQFAKAIAKTNREWASLPGSPYGQPTISMDTATNVYASNGGTFANGTMV